MSNTHNVRHPSSWTVGWGMPFKTQASAITDLDKSKWPVKYLIHCFKHATRLLRKQLKPCLKVVATI